MDKQHILPLLQELMEQRINTKKDLIESQKKLQYIEEIIAKRILDIKMDFNAKIDKNDPMYSNAEKRRVALENELARDTLLAQDKAEQKALEFKNAETKLTDDIHKIKERYLFKQIDILISDSKDNKNE